MRKQKSTQGNQTLIDLKLKSKERLKRGAELAKQYETDVLYSGGLVPIDDKPSQKTVTKNSGWAHSFICGVRDIYDLVDFDAMETGKELSEAIKKDLVEYFEQQFEIEGGGFIKIAVKSLLATSMQLIVTKTTHQTKWRKAPDFETTKRTEKYQKEYETEKTHKITFGQKGVYAATIRELNLMVTEYDIIDQDKQDKADVWDI